MNAARSLPALLLDFDGTLTKKEVLPEIASVLGLGSQMKNLTSRAMAGQDPFEESFRSRLNLLGSLPLSEVKKVINEIPLREQLLQTAQNWPGEVAVVTSNLDIWIEDLFNLLGLRFFASRAVYKNGLVLESILNKSAIVKSFVGPVIFVGDGANDVEAVSEADFGVAFNVNGVAPSALTDAADFVFTNEGDLCMFLQQF